MGILLKLDNVSISYKFGDFKDIGLKEWTVRHLTHNFNIKQFLAVDNVSFELQEGDMLGIIGVNGAGKSTLLKAVAGIMEPTMGTISRNGNISALLELGSGFDGDLSVMENAFLRGAMLGYTREFMDNTIDQIISFAELENFKDRPFKQLSSGMQARLAFSIASLVKPEILILDEVLSVGDGAFREKSSKKMKEIISGGAATLFVSHTIGPIRELCNKVLWLHNGKQIAFGETQEICDCYEKFLSGDKTALLNVDEFHTKMSAKKNDEILLIETDNSKESCSLIDFQKDYDAIISLGERCIVAHHLERSNLRMQSYPFDWVITKNVGKVAETVEHGFRDWLRLENLHETGEVEQGHAVVEDISNGFVYPHIFPLGKPIIQTYSKVIPQHQARAQRFINDITENKKLLFIRTNCSTEESRRLYKVLSNAAYPNEVYLLVVNMNNFRAFKEMPSLGKNICCVEIFEHTDHWTGYAPHWDKLLNGLKYTDRAIFKYLDGAAKEIGKEIFKIENFYSFMKDKMTSLEIQTSVYKIIKWHMEARAENTAYIYGFAGTENDTQGSFRWMNTIEAETLCMINPWDTFLFITFMNSYSTFSGHEINICIFISNELVHECHLQDQYGTIDIPLTSELIDKAHMGIFNVKIAIDRVWQPDTFTHNGDTRQLGIAIRDIKCGRKLNTEKTGAGDQLLQLQIGKAEKNQIICPICGKSSKLFKAYGLVSRNNAMCPSCGSLEGQRAGYIYLQRETDLLAPKKPIKLLHFSPEPCLARNFRENIMIDYYPVDSDPKYSNIRARVDIKDIPYKNDSFDYIICNHLLQNIDNDKAALFELYRVLNSGGKLLICVPIDSTLEQTLERQESKSSVRIYGKDFSLRLEKAGFKSQEIIVEKYFTQNEIKAFSLLPFETFYLCSKINQRVYQEDFGLNDVCISISLPESVVYAAPGESMSLKVTLCNNGWKPLSSYGDYPVFLCYHIYDESGYAVVYDGLKTPLDSDLLPGKCCDAIMSVPVPEELNMHENFVIRITLLAEHYFWFDEYSEDFYCETDLFTDNSANHYRFSWELRELSENLRKQAENKNKLTDDIVDIGQAKVFVPLFPKDWIQTQIVEKHKFYEEQQLKMIDNLLDNNSVVFDIGANIGNHSLYWGIVTGVKRIFSFEPIPITFEILKKNIEINGLKDIIAIEQLALGSQDSKVKAGEKYNIENIGSMSIVEDCRGSITVRSLDSYVSGLEQLDRIDFIKIDAESFKLEVLKGAKKTLEKFRPIIYAEIFESNKESVMQLMENYGYLDAYEIKTDKYLFLHEESYFDNEKSIKIAAKLSPVCYRRALLSVNRHRVKKDIGKSKICGISTKCRNPRLIVSLTSIPARINDIHFALHSLLNQDLKPDMVVLWLGEDRFPCREKDLPQEVISLIERGLTIMWCKDIGPYTKIIPSLRKFHDEIIITADDDIFYPDDWLKKLYESFIKDPKSIHCHRCHRIKLDQGIILPYKEWEFETKNEDASYLNFLTGVGGVLYPPNILSIYTLEEKLFKNLTSNNDDIWLWAMAVQSDVKIRHVKGYNNKLVYVNVDREKRLTGERVLGAENVDNNENDKQIKNIIDYFKNDLLDKLRN